MGISDDLADGRLYTAGQTAPPGHYRRVDGHGERVVVLERTDVLPASLDGHAFLSVQRRTSARKDGVCAPAPYVL